MTLVHAAPILGHTTRQVLYIVRTSSLSLGHWNQLRMFITFAFTFPWPFTCDREWGCSWKISPICMRKFFRCLVELHCMVRGVGWCIRFLALTYLFIFPLADAIKHTRSLISCRTCTKTFAPHLYYIALTRFMIEVNGKFPVCSSS